MEGMGEKKEEGVGEEGENVEEEEEPCLDRGGEQKYVDMKPVTFSWTRLMDAGGDLHGELGRSE